MDYENNDVYEEDVRDFDVDIEQRKALIEEAKQIEDTGDWSALNYPIYNADGAESIIGNLRMRIHWKKNLMRLSTSFMLSAESFTPVQRKPKRI